MLLTPKKRFFLGRGVTSTYVLAPRCEHRLNAVIACCFTLPLTGIPAISIGNMVRIRITGHWVGLDTFPCQLLLFLHGAVVRLRTLSLRHAMPPLFVYSRARQPELSHRPTTAWQVLSVRQPHEQRFGNGAATLRQPPPGPAPPGHLRFVCIRYGGGVGTPAVPVAVRVAVAVAVSVAIAVAVSVAIAVAVSVSAAAAVVLSVSVSASVSVSVMVSASVSPQRFPVVDDQRARECASATPHDSSA